MKRISLAVIALVVSLLAIGGWIRQEGNRNPDEINAPVSGIVMEPNGSVVEGSGVSPFSVQESHRGEQEALSLEDGIDAVSLRLYGARVGAQGSTHVDTAAWNEEKIDELPLSFKYPKGANVINEGNCYRVEYGFGFVIFLLPVDGDARCGARTGVGVFPGGVDVSDVLTINGERYDAPGFRAIIDREDGVFKGGKRYSYDFHQMFDYALAQARKGEACFQDKTCMRIGYGIYEEADVPLKKHDIDEVMETLREIVESVQVDR